MVGPNAPLDKSLLASLFAAKAQDLTAVAGKLLGLGALAGANVDDWRARHPAEDDEHCSGCQKSGDITAIMANAM